MEAVADDLRYPIGRFDATGSITPSMRAQAISVIANLPADMHAAVAALSDRRLDTPYRPGGWTVRQVVHHVVDSHVNAYIRTKVCLTENEPAIKAYDQDAWALLPDSHLPVGVSLMMLEGLHARWAALWNSIAPEQSGRVFHHPQIGTVTLDGQLQMYAWHSRHHLAHITSLRQREGWGATAIP